MTEGDLGWMALTLVGLLVCFLAGPFIVRGLALAGALWLELILRIVDPDDETWNTKGRKPWWGPPLRGMDDLATYLRNVAGWTLGEGD